MNDKKPENELKTFHEWEDEFGIKVLDPDGFDRTDPKLYERKMTREEFEQGLMRSTIIFKPKTGGNQN